MQAASKKLLKSERRSFQSSCSQSKLIVLCDLRNSIDLGKIKEKEENCDTYAGGYDHFKINQELFLSTKETQLISRENVNVVD